MTSINLWSSDICAIIHKESTPDAYVSIRRHQKGLISKVKTQINISFRILQDIFSNYDSLLDVHDNLDFVFTSGSFTVRTKEYNDVVYACLEQKISGVDFVKKINLRKEEWKHVMSYLLNNKPLLTVNELPDGFLPNSMPYFTVAKSSHRFFTYSSAQSYLFEVTGRHGEVKEGGYMESSNWINRKKLINNFMATKVSNNIEMRLLDEMLTMFGFEKFNSQLDYKEQDIPVENDIDKPYEFLIKSLI